MSLIVDMELPTGCSWVEKGIEKRCPMAGIDHYLQIRCRVQGGRIVHTSNQSGIVDCPSWCPIVGVLPEQHGRLVDADACSSVLRKLENEAKTNTEKLCYGYSARMFEEAFTIIAAERKDDGKA